MVRAIFFGHVNGAAVVANFAGLPQTRARLDTVRQRLTAWKTHGEKSSYPGWVVQDIKTAKTTAEQEIGKQRAALERRIEASKQKGALTQTVGIHKEADGTRSVFFVVQLTKDVTTMARRNEKGEFDVTAIATDDYQKLVRKRREDKISKAVFWTGMIAAGVLTYLEGNAGFALAAALQLGILRLLHKIIINTNPVFRAFKGAEHTDFVLKFFEDTRNVIIEKLEKVENGIQQLTGQKST
ncbi:Uncharacterised protein [Candidatus Bilamarchaeum dharawalense]|uniref:Uncharacterized protein n=1 Tax=Candidatus Bilamarchaeum dharawalense TaxID=2885759 RepID=A0A5E4LQ48_9ARCH|nr:Uncharacterised protein [Candidatus Bilamarchaeum dharawalense]